MRMVIFVSFLFVSVMAFAQKQIAGTVKDVGGEPLVGVSIVEIGTNNGTVTDIDGNYTISTHPDATLRFSYVGYVTQEMKVKPVMSVVLIEDSQVLGEVVVVGYGSMQRKDVTSSILVCRLCNPRDESKACYVGCPH